MPNAGGLAPKKNTAIWTYDFDKYGGAVGDITLDELLPSNAVITYAYAHVVAACTSAGAATVAARIMSPEDVVAATALASLVIASNVDGVPDNTAGNMIVTTANMSLIVTVEVADLTAGKINFVVEYDIVGA